MSERPPIEEHLQIAELDANIQPTREYSIAVSKYALRLEREKQEAVEKIRGLTVLHNDSWEPYEQGVRYALRFALRVLGVEE